MLGRSWTRPTCVLFGLLSACAGGKSDTGFDDTGRPDRRSPDVTLDAPLDGETLTGSVSWAATASDDVGVSAVLLLVDQDEVDHDRDAPYGGTWDTTTALNGTHLLDARAEDEAGNDRTASATVTVDNEGGLDPDAIAISSPSGAVPVCGTVTVQTVVSDEVVRVTFSLSGVVQEEVSAAPFSWDWDTTVVRDGSYRIEATAADAEGREAVDSLAIEVLNEVASCDNAPSVYFTSPDADAWLRGTEAVTVTTGDDLGVVGVSFFLDGGLVLEDATAPYELSLATTDLGDGDHVLGARATDTIGQTGDAEISVHVDNEAPEVEILSPAEGDQLSGTISFSASVADNLGIERVELSVDGDVVGSPTEAPYEVEVDTTGLAYGEHTFGARAVDYAGNESTDAVVAGVDNPPAVVFTEPDDTDVSGTVTVSATATDDDRLTDLTLAQNGVSVASTTTSSVSWTVDTCLYEHGDTIAYVAEASDSGGNTTRERLTLSVDQPPQVEIGTYADPLDYTTTLSASVSDDEAVTVVWDVDGTTVATSTRTSVTEEDCFDCGCKVFTADFDTSVPGEGSHTLTVTVTNASGDTATDSTTVRIDFDHDADGYDAEFYGGDDCDDEAGETNPDTAETCDGEDNDCDHRADEDFDGDRDGYLDVLYCSDVADGTDCDDADADINPGEIEACDEVDNDCDGLVDLSTAYLSASTTFGTSSHPLSSSGTWGNVYKATTNAVIASFQAYLNPGSSSFTATYAVYEATSSTGDYTRVASGTGTVASGAGWYTSPSMDVEMSAGRYYLVTVSTSSALTRLGDSTSPTLDSGSGLTLVGYSGSTTAGATTISADPSASQTYYQVMTMSVPSTADADKDADGYSAYCGDCDESDDEISPDGVETCDGQDNDCNGIDDDTEDLDGDGTYACEDCDDADDGVYPGATERCNDLDDDCDDAVDEDAADATTWYRDTDGDGYGIAGVTEALCGAEDGWSTVSTDCDDGDGDAHPGAAERCNDADDDCDDEVDEGFTDADGDGYSACVDCDDGDGDVSPGAREVCGDAYDEDCDGLAPACGYTGTVALTTYASAWWGEKASEYAGQSPSWAGDLDGDGLADLAIASVRNDDSGSNAGVVYLLPGPASTGGTLGSSPTVELFGATAGDAVGVPSNACDQDGDGYDDLIVGAGLLDGTYTDAGGAYVVLGPIASDMSLSAADAFLSGNNGGDNSGASVRCMGDVDGDGNPDLAVGAPSTDETHTDQGGVYLLSGPVTEDAALEDADTMLLGWKSTAYVVGTLPDAPGDHDGDGYDDVLIGSYRGKSRFDTSYSGEAYVVGGPVAGILELDDADALLTSEAVSDYAAYTVAWMDADGDGYSDAVISAIHHDTSVVEGGAAYIVNGPVSSLNLAAADLVLSGSTRYGSLGYYGLSAGPDVDLDGYDDLLVGGQTGSSTTSAFVFYGPITADAADTDADIEIEVSGSTDAILAHDLDGDGYGDFFVSVFDADHGSTKYTGAAYTLLYADLP